MTGTEPKSALPGVVGLHHVALAVADLDAAIELWTGTFGARVALRDVVEVQGVEAAALAWDGAAGGAPGLPHGTELELVAPAPGEAGARSGVARFLEMRGAGLHHVAWAVDDVATSLAAAVALGMRAIDSAPRPGLHGTPVAFLHPRSAGGVLVELVQVAPGSQRA